MSNTTTEKFLVDATGERHVWTSVDSSEAFNTIVDFTDPDPEWRYIAEVEEPFFRDVTAAMPDKTLYEVTLECEFDFNLSPQGGVPGAFAADGGKMAYTFKGDGEMLLSTCTLIAFTVQTAQEALLDG